jgi:hypothetical protein
MPLATTALRFSFSFSFQFSLRFSALSIFGYAAIIAAVPLSATADIEPLIFAAADSFRLPLFHYFIFIIAGAHADTPLYEFSIAFRRRRRRRY